MAISFALALVARLPPLWPETRAASKAIQQDWKKLGEIAESVLAELTFVR